MLALGERAETVFDTDVASMGMNRLQRTIQGLLTAQGMTKADLARKSGVPKQTIYNLMSPANALEQRAPRPATLAKLARGLGVRESILLDAVNELRGYDVEQVELKDPELKALMSVADQLPPNQRNQVRRMLKSFLDSLGGE
jgi:transcriptional regulator with XRE-family HTH domain